MADAASAPTAQAAFDTNAEHFHGLDCQRLRLPCGDTVLVALQGAHVLSWVSQGRERLFLSERNVWDGQSAIRGGVPVCFPQFNQRGDLPKHGFARNLIWQCVTRQEQDHNVAAHNASAANSASEKNGSPSTHPHLDFVLQTGPATLAFWPQHFVATLRVSLQPQQLHIALYVHNTDTQPLFFTGALHTYLAVNQIAEAQLTGLQGQAEWNAVTDEHGQATEVLRFEGEFDRVYQAAPHALSLEEGEQRLRIEQSPSWGQSVVWNPGAQKCGSLPDMTPQAYQRMLCVEAAQVYEPIRVPAQGQWLGWQRLSLV